jgi:metal-responsive CopG/Arc/MetJ family transcriptional regulator
MHEERVTISVSIPSKLLAKVDQMEGNSQNEKLVKCIRTGYDILRVK